MFYDLSMGGCDARPLISPVLGFVSSLNYTVNSTALLPR